MRYLVTRAELQALLAIARSKSYLLEEQGILPKPINGFGRNKLFDLKQSLINAYQAKGWPCPSEDFIENQWKAILATRLQSH
jgi:hypothetical protein